MAADRPELKKPAEVDLDASPFELQAIEGLPLTKTERAELARVIAELDRVRGATASD